MERISVGEGINLHYLQTKKFKTDLLLILFREKLCKEYVTINSLLPSVMLRGCNEFIDITEINNYLENLYGAVFDAGIIKKGSNQIIQFYLDFIRLSSLSNGAENIFNSATNFMSQMVYNPLLNDNGFVSAIVEVEKQNLHAQIENSISNKSEFAKRRCLEIMFEGDAYSLNADGYTKDIVKITSQNLYEQYNKILEEAPLDILYIGEEGKQSVLSTVEKRFIPSSRKFKNSQTEISKMTQDINFKLPSKMIIEDMNLSQAKLCIGIGIGTSEDDSDWYECIIANEIFGGGASSKLFLSVRERENICYYINSTFLRFRKSVLVQAGIDSTSFERAVTVIKDEVQNMVQGKISEEEFQSAKDSLVSRFESIQDSANTIADFHISQYILGDSADLETVLRKIGSVSLEDVKKVAETFSIVATYLLK